MRPAVSWQQVSQVQPVSFRLLVLNDSLRHERTTSQIRPRLEVLGGHEKLAGSALHAEKEKEISCSP